MTLCDNQQNKSVVNMNGDTNVTPAVIVVQDDTQKVNATNASSPNPIDYEIVLAKVYGNGRYQMIVLAICSIVCFMAGFENQAMLFTDYTPNFTCHQLEEAVVVNTSGLVWLTGRQHETFVRGSCTSQSCWNASTSHFESIDQCWGVVTNPSPSSNEEEATDGAYTTYNYKVTTCEKWNFTVGQMHESAVSDFNLVCGRAKLLPLIKTIFLLFNAIGFVFASLTDFVGRRWTLLTFTLIACVGSLTLPFANSLALYIILRCLTGFWHGTAYLCLGMISELVPINKRAVYGTIFWFFWSIGLVTTALIAYLVPYWRQMKLWGCLALLPCISFKFFIIESPRWLSANGKLEQAAKNLRWIAKINNVDISGEDWFGQNLSSSFDKIDSSNDHCQAKSSTRETLFSLIWYSRRLRLRLVSCCVVLASITCVYYQIITDGTFASSNIFLNVFLMGLVESPSSFLAYKLCDKVGRRRSTLYLLLLSAVISAVFGLIDRRLTIVRLLVGAIIKLSITVIYCIFDLAINELFPSSVRSSAFFFTAVVAALVYAPVPFAKKLADYGYFLPGLVSALVATLGALVVFLFVPETKDQPLPQTIWEAEQLGAKVGEGRSGVRKTTRC